MKIGITCYPTYGGSGAVATELGLALAQRGHEIHFVTYAQPFRLVGLHERVFYHEVEMEDYPLFEHPPYSLALAVALPDAARREELDVLHMHYAIPHAASAFLAREMLEPERDIQIVTTLHGTDITLVGQDRSFFEITRFGIEQSDGVTAVSEFLKRMTVDEFEVGQDIEVIPNFVDLTAYCRQRGYKERSAFAGGGEKILLHISNFRPVKRPLDTVRILERVNREVPAVLLLVGEGPERASAQALARRLGLEERVRFLGRQDRVEELTGVRVNVGGVST